MTTTPMASASGVASAAPRMTTAASGVASASTTVGVPAPAGRADMSATAVARNAAAGVISTVAAAGISPIGGAAHDGLPHIQLRPGV